MSAILQCSEASDFKVLTFIISQRISVFNIIRNSLTGSDVLWQQCHSTLIGDSVSYV